MKMKKINIFIIILISFFLFGFSYNKCFKCHKKNKILSGKNIHTPLKKGECAKCHMAHVSRYDNLLKQKPGKLCIGCHKKLLDKIKGDKVIHAPVEKKACVRCHDTHSSNNKALLKEKPAKLCIQCHKEVNKKYKFSHLPFRKGNCLKCHSGHSSNDRRFLKKQGSEICINCHKITANLNQKHRYKLTNKNCLSCHNPHGSNSNKLLRKTGHKPYKDKKCSTCHKNKEKFSSLVCFSCHKEEKKSFSKLHNHLLGGINKNSCLICHDPHMGVSDKHLKEASHILCQKCHPETYVQKKDSLYVHPNWKNCTNCHKGHGSNQLAMLKKDGNGVCVNCHKTQGKFTHPVGDKIKDPRNGQNVTCVTCHDTMGTNFKNNLRLSGEGALCLECHKNY